jgi:hypothetical protein
VVTTATPETSAPTSSLRKARAKQKPISLSPSAAGDSFSVKHDLLRSKAVRRRSPHLPLLSTGAGLALTLFVGAPGCADLRLADVSDGGSGSSDGPPGDPDSGGTDAERPNSDATTDAPKGPRLYDDVQKALEAKRFPGPPTPQGSKGYCTSKYFVWSESDGTLHSWAASNQARIDYGFKAGGTRSYFVPADTYIAVDVPPTYSEIDVYRTDQANSLVGSTTYSFNFVTSNDGVIRLDQVVGGVDVGGTQVRRWNAGTMAIEDITTVLPTREPPSSFVNDTLVIPGSVTVPFALWVVDVVKKTSTSVTFDGGISLTQTEEGSGGLVISYVRNGTARPAIRLYKKNQDDAASRFELGDEVANRANVLPDGPAAEHKFVSRIATWNQKVLYASAYGIWSYDVISGSLAPVQLGAGKKAAVPDVMCVLGSADVLVYRLSGDTLGQVWAVPLKTLSL